MRSINDDICAMYDKKKVYIFTTKTDAQQNKQTKRHTSTHAHS